VAACRRATAQGYVLALDDFDGRETLEPLLEHVRIVKVDVQQHPPDALAALVRRLRARGLTVLAERVETDAVRRQCADYGCTLFQGYVFSRPETLGGRSVPAQQAAILNLLGLLDDESVGEAQLDEAMRGHPSIAHALLGLVGSAAMGAREVRSIPQAIRLVGRGSLRRWMLVLLAASAASQGPVAHEAALQALVRARFAERIAEAAGLADPGSHFLVGLLSRLDVLLGVPLPEAVARLPLGDDVRTALLTGDGALGRVLAVVEAWQGADWDAVPALVTAAGVSAVGLPELFADATAWAGDRLPVAMARRVTSRG
jgi:EAL and modified HD-GYP domain-containing signal transduction protein